MQENRPSLSNARAILERVTDAFYSVDSEWRFTYVNHQAHLLLQRQPGELLGKSVWEEFPTLLGTECEEIFRASARDNSSGVFTFFYPDHQRWYEIRCYAAADGLSVFFRDETPRIEADQKLREGETRFQMMTSAIPQIVWIADGDGRIEFFNEQWHRYAGSAVTPASLHQFNAAFVHAEDRAATLDAWRSALASNATFAIEHRVRAASGEYRWFLSRAEPHRNTGSGNIIRWFGTSTDIHVQRQAVSELARITVESERRRRFYETFLTNTPDLSYVFDLDHRFTYANKVLLEMWGKTWDEAIGKNCLELGYEPWHAEMHDREIEQVRATKQPVRGDVPFNGAFGRRIYDYILFPVLGSDGEVEAVAGTTRDVTDRKNAEARHDALVRMTDEIRSQKNPEEVAYAAARILGETLGASRVGYGSLDPSGEVLNVGREWSVPGYERPYDITKLSNFGMVIDELRRGEFVVVANVAVDPRTLPVAASFEERHAVAFVAVPMIENGLLVAILYVISSQVRTWTLDDLALIGEIAERTRTASERILSESALADSEARLRQINESLEAEVATRTRELMVAEEALRHSQKMEAVGQLTGGLAHDFNNLLAGIMGGLELTRAKFAQGRTDGIDRYIDVSLRGVTRAAALTQRLLAFARRQTLDPKPTNVNRLIAGMEDMIRRTIGPAIDLEVVGAGGIWSTFVDAPQLENAILNLCINARDAMPDGGRLTIETANKWLDGKWASERDLSPGQYISLCVTDTGTGMSPDVIARVFDPFFTTKPIGEGTGLGLSMVYGFARQSGGQVRIYSEVGAGTTMCIYLPRHMQEQAEADEQEMNEHAEPGGTGEIVLVVDDEAAIRMLIAEVLNEAGYIAIEAADGPSALRILQSKARIDLLITDVGLPGGINGRQVADAGRLARPGLKVLFITGYAENAAVGNGHLEPGMQVMTKPFKMESLARRIREIVEDRT